MVGCVKEKMKANGLGGGTPQAALLEEMKILKEMQDSSATRKALNSELWHACAGPLVSLPQLGSLVFYFPQGHNEQVAISTKRTYMTQIPNYPNVPSQLMCQVHNVTLHADKDTDEIYAQMSLQPVHSERDIFPMPDYGLSSSKHPSEYFCKTLTASDTSTHGGFSVPRRAAEKLFPPLDFTAQPPTQELVVRDLHNNTWTFRHIYRGQPKRHLLTTGWSLFVGSKRLKAGDSVLFIRDEKSQLLVGVRHANRESTTSLPSSVLSADSMHIGVLAAAAHASASRSLFTVFYNPRACPSEFVIPLVKYRRCVQGTQLCVGMRFGMMFETDDSGKRRYMGTIAGISDLDSVRWPGSKWRNLQVEWDEPGCNDKPTRVSAWEIETPESLFVFPSLTSGFKRPLHPGLLETEWGSLVKRPLIRVPDFYSEELIKTMLKPQFVNNARSPAPTVQSMVPGALLEEGQITEAMIDQKPQFFPSESKLMGTLNHSHTSLTKENMPVNLYAPGKPENQALDRTASEEPKSEPEHSTEQVSQVTSAAECNEEKVPTVSTNPQNHVNQVQQHEGLMKLQNNQCPMQNQLETSQQIHIPPSDSINANELSPLPETEELTSHLSSFQSLSGMYRSPGPILSEEQNPSMGLYAWDHQLNDLRLLSPADQFNPFMQDLCSLSSGGLRNLEDGSINETGNCSFVNNVSHNGSAALDPCVSGTVLDEFCPFKETKIQNPSTCLVGTLSSSQDIQSQITSASFGDLQDNSGGATSSNIDFDEGSLLQSGSSWQQVAPQRIRTYTKVQKAGSVGRSIDVTSFRNYDELISAIDHMFGLAGLLNDPKGSGWKLVYVDYENDVLLIGDDPWEEFIGCVRCIRILSPAEVQRMGEEGMKLLNSTAMQISPHV